MALRVAIVHDDELVRLGLAAILRPQGQFELVTDPAEHGPVDIALFDPLAGSYRESGLATLVASSHVARVAIYTWNFQPWSAGDWIRRGASGYLSKALPATALVEALLAIQVGRTIVAPGRHEAVSSRWVGQEHGLTEREAQMLALIASGMTNAEVAEYTRLSVNSIKSYIRSCYRKIDVTSRSQAVVWAIAHGLGGENPPTRFPSSDSA